MSQAPFPIHPHYTAIAIAYRNKNLIADSVLPRVPVSKQAFTYMKHSLAEAFTIPDTKVGRTSKPNQVSFSATETTASTEDFGLEDPIPQRDIENQPDNYDVIGKSTEYLSNLILLDREKRCADLVFNAANYPAANKTQLAGGDQFSDFINSDPIGVIIDALDSAIMRPNIGIFGRLVFSKLQRHPRIINAITGQAGVVNGIAKREAIAELLELEEILVGESFVNTAKKGQAVSLARVWGKHVAFIYRDMLADASRGTTFGFTAQFGTRVAGSAPDGDIGLKGGQRNRVGESVKELISANDLGFFIQDAVA